MTELTQFALLMVSAVALIVLAVVAISVTKQAAKNINPDVLPVIDKLFSSTLLALADTVEKLIASAPDIEHTELDDKFKQLLRDALADVLASRDNKTDSDS